MSGPLVSPIAGLLALLGGFTKFLVIPAECLPLGVGGGGAVRWCGGVSAACSRMSAANAGAVLSERADEIGEASHFYP